MSGVSVTFPVSRGRRLAGMVGYAAIYLLVLPVLLALWMRRLDATLGLPPWGSPMWGIVLATAGLLLMAAGALALWRLGGGLPMSPYPPVRLVTRGVYRFMSHPVYTGAVLVCAGGSLIWRSTAGLLIVTPVLALSALAFVLGYERDATRERFGQPPLTRQAAPARLPIRLARATWLGMCRATEAVANSWREFRIGPVRFMSHGVFAALGATLGSGVAIWLAGSSETWWIVGMTLASELGAAVWAQVIEGSSLLLRPYGYFGAVGGAVVFASVVGATGHNGWLLLAAMAPGACITQAFGRVRCLIQGCCHGRLVDAAWGIRYRHPRSRVVWFSHMRDQRLHPTPLYSILWTLLTAAALLLLWRLAVPLPVIPGAYLILIGLGRFVEEHFRGEPQTACFWGLRLYQWLAIAFVVCGAAMTAVGGPPAAPADEPPGVAVASILAGLMAVTYCAFGVDFPRSNRRFSRLV